MNLRNKGVRRLLNRKGPQCWVFRFPLDSSWLWFWALPFFQWHKQQGMPLCWEERFWLDWERLKLFWGLEASESPVLPWLLHPFKAASRESGCQAWTILIDILSPRLCRDGLGNRDHCMCSVLIFIFLLWVKNRQGFERCCPAGCRFISMFIGWACPSSSLSLAADFPWGGETARESKSTNRGRRFPDKRFDQVRRCSLLQDSQPYGSAKR